MITVHDTYKGLKGYLEVRNDFSPFTILGWVPENVIPPRLHSPIVVAIKSDTGSGWDAQISPTIGQFDDGQGYRYAAVEAAPYPISTWRRVPGFIENTLA